MAAKETCTAVQAAHHIGLTRQAVLWWARKPSAPVKQVGRNLVFLWPDFPRWRERELLAEKRVKGDEPRQRRDTAEAALKELDVLERRGELMPVAEAEQALGAAFARVRSWLLNLPHAIGTRVTADTLPARVAEARAVVDEVMAELATGRDIPNPKPKGR